jgi:hypothetical protein
MRRPVAQKIFGESSDIPIARPVWHTRVQRLTLGRCSGESLHTSALLHANGSDQEDALRPHRPAR